MKDEKTTEKPDKITPLSTEGQIVIEEKQSKPNGEVNIIQYVRGNFLGKVSKTSPKRRPSHSDSLLLTTETKLTSLYRVALLSAMSSHESMTRSSLQAS
jgi:hypothetical protein